MNLVDLELADFRSFATASFRPEPEGITVVTGPNGAGKTTLLEAVAYLGIQRSFRATPREALVRTGQERAVLRARLNENRREVLVEAEIVPGGRSRAQLNRQPARPRDLARAVPVTVFCPDDLGLVQGGPARRREVLDDGLAVLDPMTGALVEQVERILRQRGALLRQSGGRLSPEVAQTLDVWDERLATTGDRLASAREELARAVEPLLDESYASLAGVGAERPGEPLVELRYVRSWEGTLASALAVVRGDDVRRGVSTVGPHRDDLEIRLAGRDSRVQASQGEQRCLALALRLAVHRLLLQRSGQVPILLLDDVFSELDPRRSAALLRELPMGQALLTTATPLPAGAQVARVVDVATVGERPGWQERTPA